MQASPDRRTQRIKASASRCALHKQPSTRGDLQSCEQTAADRAKVQDITSCLFERQITRDGVKLRCLRDQELRMASSFGFISLDGKTCIHRVIANLRAKQIIGPGIDRDHVADLHAALCFGFTAQRRDQRNAAGAGNLNVLFMAVKWRYRNARQRPYVVEVYLGRQHVNKRFIRRRLWHLNNQLALVRRWWAEARRTSIGIAGNAICILKRWNGGNAGEKRRAQWQ